MAKKVIQLNISPEQALYLLCVHTAHTAAIGAARGRVPKVIADTTNMQALLAGQDLIENNQLSELQSMLEKACSSTIEKLGYARLGTDGELTFEEPS